MNKSTIIVAALIVLIGIGTYALMMQQKSHAKMLAEAPIVPAASAATSTQTQASGTAASSAQPHSGTPSVVNGRTEATQTILANSLVLGEIKTGGLVTVGEASLTKPGFIVLYQINSKGEIATVGHSDLLRPGVHTGVQIQSSTVLAYQQILIAVLHQDNGDGVFKSTNDPYLPNAAGNVVSDADVVDVTGITKEASVLKERIAAYLEMEFPDARG